MYFAQKISMKYFSFDFQLCMYGRIMNHWRLYCNYLLMTMTVHTIFIIIFFISGHQACLTNCNNKICTAVELDSFCMVYRDDPKCSSQEHPTASPDEKLTETCVCGESRRLSCALPNDLREYSLNYILIGRGSALSAT